VEPLAGPVIEKPPPENDHCVTVPLLTVQVTDSPRVTVAGKHDSWGGGAPPVTCTSVLFHAGSLGFPGGSANPKPLYPLDVTVTVASPSGAFEGIVTQPAKWVSHCDPPHELLKYVTPFWLMVTFGFVPKPVPSTQNGYVDPACHGGDGSEVTLVMLGVGSPPPDGVTVIGPYDAVPAQMVTDVADWLTCTCPPACVSLDGQMVSESAPWQAQGGYPEKPCPYTVTVTACPAFQGPEAETELICGGGGGSAHRS
jgi:hypothetical protein